MRVALGHDGTVHNTGFQPAQPPRQRLAIAPRRRRIASQSPRSNMRHRGPRNTRLHRRRRRLRHRVVPLRPGAAPTVVPKRFPASRPETEDAQLLALGRGIDPLLHGRLLEGDVAAAQVPEDAFCASRLVDVAACREAWADAPEGAAEGFAAG
ncbi:hypothetical protein VDGD_02104 [Verticillium dahliae]|nr:hypothetical protein VDGD_02104 [Verticillium dahliae]